MMLMFRLSLCFCCVWLCISLVPSFSFLIGEVHKASPPAKNNSTKASTFLRNGASHHRLKPSLPGRQAHENVHRAHHHHKSHHHPHPQTPPAAQEDENSFGELSYFTEDGAKAQNAIMDLIASDEYAQLIQKDLRELFPVEFVGLIQISDDAEGDNILGLDADMFDFHNLFVKSRHFVPAVVKHIPQLSVEEKRVCVPDIERFECESHPRGILHCLAAHKGELSPGCTGRIKSSLPFACHKEILNMCDQDFLLSDIHPCMSNFRSHDSISSECTKSIERTTAAVQKMEDLAHLLSSVQSSPESSEPPITPFYMKLSSTLHSVLSRFLPTAPRRANYAQPRPPPPSFASEDAPRWVPRLPSDEEPLRPLPPKVGEDFRRNYEALPLYDASETTHRRPPSPQPADSGTTFPLMQYFGVGMILSLLVWGWARWSRQSQRQADRMSKYMYHEELTDLGVDVSSAKAAKD